MVTVYPYKHSAFYIVTNLTLNNINRLSDLFDGRMVLSFPRTDVVMCFWNHKYVEPYEYEFEAQIKEVLE